MKTETDTKVKKKLKDLRGFARKKCAAEGNRVQPTAEFSEFGRGEIEQTITACCERRVKGNPDKIAVQSADEGITYAFLHSRARRVARQILKTVDRASCPGEKEYLPSAALLFGHGIAMIIGIISALEAGKIYVPLDPGYPQERLQYMLEDSEARLIITDTTHYPQAQTLKNSMARDIEIIDIHSQEEPDDSLPHAEPGSEDPDRLAYILYTSGSTGTPKGVMQNHRNVLHFARVYTNALHISSRDRLTLFSTYGFDAAQMDIYGALLNGATLYPFDIKREGSLECLPHWLNAEQITIFHAVPTLYRYFTAQLDAENDKNANPPLFPHLRLVVLGGEAVNIKDVETYKKYFPDHCIFINGLGPTESTVTLQYFIDKETVLTKEAVPVGNPVEETEVILLDEQDKETAVNAVGEIVYKSAYLALGYLKQPGKTNQVFVTDPLTGDGRVYRSGDLGRRLEDGSIEFLGRKDLQVKIRGSRIEPGEIESHLDRQPGIRKSVVVSRTDQKGENHLIAFYTTGDPTAIPDEDDLVRRLKEALPDYMIPSAIFRLEEFPLTSTGKIHRQALEKDDRYIAIDRTAYKAPRDETERKLAAIWHKVLNIERREAEPGGSEGISTRANFFVLGGNSLRAILLASEIDKTFQIKIPLQEIFNNPYIENLAQYIAKAGIEKYRALEPTEEREYYPLSAPQRGIFGWQQRAPGSTAYNMCQAVHLDFPVEPKRLETTIKKMLERYENFRTSFVVIGEEPVQRVHSPGAVEFELEYLTTARDTGSIAGTANSSSIQDTGLTGSPGTTRGNTAAAIKHFSRPFDLARAPLLRAGLIQFPAPGPFQPAYTLLLIDMHHIISDGVTYEILRKDLFSQYNGGELPPVRVRYKDYAVWQNSGKIRKAIEPQKQFWLKTYAGKIPVLNLPYDFPRPVVKNFASHPFRSTIAAPQAHRLYGLAEQTGTTIYMVLLAAYFILLAKYSNQEDIVVGSPVTGRRQADLLPIMGMLVNMLSLRNRPEPHKTFGDFLKEVKTNAIACMENQDYYFAELTAELRLHGNPGRNPLFDVVFVLQPASTANTAGTPPPGDNSPYLIQTQAGPEPGIIQTGFDLLLHAAELENRAGLALNFQYSTALFKPSSIEEMARHYNEILNQAVENTGIRIQDIVISYDLAEASDLLAAGEDDEDREFDF